MNTFDQTARIACKFDPNNLFRWLFRLRGGTSPEFHSWDDTRRLPSLGQPDRVNDLVARLADPDPDSPTAHAIVEAQSEAAWDIFLRAGEYQLFLLRELSRDAPSLADTRVYCFVLNLTGRNPKAWRSATGDACVRPKVVNLIGLSARRLLDDIEAGTLSPSLLLWLPLMKGGGDRKNIERWKLLIGLEPSEDRRKEVRSLALTFAELSKKLVRWQRSLEGWDVRESQLVLGWKREGFEEGDIKRARAALLDVIAARLEDPVPEDLADAVEGTTEPAILREWLLAAATTTSVAKLRKLMKKT